jgi:MFS family permease
MNSEFSELSHSKYRKRRTRRRVYLVFGLLLMVAGYLLMGVAPDAKQEWALTRAVVGLGCIVVGFGLAILPLLSTWTSGE